MRADIAVLSNASSIRQHLKLQDREDHVVRHCMHYVSYAAMVYAMLVCKLFFKASLRPSCCMLLQLGADSRLLMTVNELTHFYAGASDVVSVGKTYRCSRNCWTIVMNSYLTRL